MTNEMIKKFEIAVNNYNDFFSTSYYNKKEIIISEKMKEILENNGYEFRKQEHYNETRLYFDEENNYFVLGNNLYTKTLLQDNNWMISNKYNINESDYKILTIRKNKSIISFEKENGDIGYWDLSKKDLNPENKEDLPYTTKKKDKNGKIRTAHVKSLRNFFAGYRVYNLYAPDSAYGRFLKIVQKYEYKISSIQSFIDKFEEYTYIEQFLLYPNLKVDLGENQSWSTETGKKVISSYHKLKHGINEYDKNFIKALIKYEIPLSREIENFYFDNHGKKHLECFYLLAEKRHEDHKFDEFLKLLLKNNTYYLNFNTLQNANLDIKRYIEYICYLVDFEGLDLREAIREHRDYLDMIKTMSEGGKIRNKYPKYLLSIHAITTKNYRRFRREYDKKRFKLVVDEDDYKRLEYSSKKEKYIVLRPLDDDDIKREAVDMCNCVSSYIDRIINRETKILFVRKANAPNESFITMEIRDNKMIQAYAKMNRKPDEESLEFISRYCKNKKVEQVHWRNLE